MIKYVVSLLFVLVSYDLCAANPNVNQLLSVAASTSSSAAAVSKSQDALSVLMNQSQGSVESSAPVSSNQALQFFMAQQNNVWYKKAIEIITNPAYKKRYQQGLLNMQMFFLEYASSTLRTLAEQHEQNTTPDLQLVLQSFAQKDVGPQSTSDNVSIHSLLNVLDNSRTSIASTSDVMNSLVQKMLNTAQSIKKPEQTHAAGVQYLLHVVQTNIPKKSRAVSAQQVLSSISSPKSPKKVQKLTASSLLKQV